MFGILRRFYPSAEGFEGSALVSSGEVHRLSLSPMLIFLDFDGVLHPDGCNPSSYFSCAPLLEAVLRQSADFEVVISSSWRHSRPFDELVQLFSADVRRYFVGVTPDSRYVEMPVALGLYPRQAEIEVWLRENARATDMWVAIDDRPWLFKPFFAQLIKTHPDHGMTLQTCEDLLRRKALLYR